MVKRLIEQRSAVNLYLLEHELDLVELTRNEWKVLENLVHGLSKVRQHNYRVTSTARYRSFCHW